MEVQVLVAQDKGEIYKEGKSNSYTDGIQTWFPFRLPKHANTIPIDNDFEIKYDLAKHSLGIGMTGWDYKNKVSKFVCFDFDSISGHSDKHSNKLSESELLEVQESVKAIKWVQLRYSTSGSGLHLYVFVDNIITQNHTEHSALARSILAMMSGTVNYDFQSKVDALGGVLWQWHRKMLGTRGLKLIKEYTELCPVSLNWKDHLPVIQGKKSKAIPGFIEEKEQDAFTELCGQKARVKLDEDHKKHIKWLQDNGHTCTYNQDLHIFIVHTHALKQMYNELKLKGLFDTIATGSQPGDINAWKSPLNKGGWVVRRYTQGIIETPNWDQDASGYTKCYLNKIPEFKIIARSFDAIEHPTGGFVFISARKAQEAANILNINLNLPEFAMEKKCKLKMNKEGRLITELEYDSNGDAVKGGLPGYLQEGKNWKKIFDNPSNESEIDSASFDDIVRHMVSGANVSVGWSIKSYNNAWESNPLKHTEKVLTSLGYQGTDVSQILGTSILKSWKLVNKPFQPEYPGNREWNKNSAQLRFVPSSDRDSLNYPTWNIILDHLGKGLNESLLKNEWAKINNIIKGSEYLKLWLASILQKPEEHLPYLFLYGPEDCGKSTLQEAINLLISNGVQRADQALISQGSFNAEIEFAVVCAVEETDLRKNKTAAAKIKDFVTSRKITIHRKNQTPYDSINIGHWLQTSNDPKHCPIFPGDSRITMIKVESINKDKMISKRDLFKQLEKEAPDILAELLHLEIPICEERLNIPVVITEEKIKAQKESMNSLELFLTDVCYYSPGSLIKFSDFHDKFLEYLDPQEVYMWSKVRVGRELPEKYPHGRSTYHNSQHFIGNIAWIEDKHKNGKEEGIYEVKEEKLILIKGK